jgi:hypothetical protein
MNIGEPAMLITMEAEYDGGKLVFIDKPPAGKARALVTLIPFDTPVRSELKIDWSLVDSRMDRAKGLLGVAKGADAPGLQDDRSARVLSKGSR